MNSLYPFVVAAPTIGLSVFCVAQVAVARMSPGLNPYRSLSHGFLCGLLTVVAIAGCAASYGDSSLRDSLGYVVLDVFTYLALAFGYFNFVNLTIASLRIRLLEELQEARGMMNRAQLIGRHSSENVMAIRLERLVRGGHLIERNGRLFSGRLAFLMVARIFDGLRWAIVGHRGNRKVVS